MNKNYILTKKSKATRIYSESFKQLVVNEYKKGFLSIEKLQRKYGIRKQSVIWGWIKNDPEFEARRHTSRDYPFRVR